MKLALSFAAKIAGQAVSGNIIGTVTDPSGAGIPAATITVKNVGIGVSTQVTTNNSGNYTVADFTPGNYTVTITQAGFQKVTQQNVAVIASQTAPVDASLKLGQETQEVTVSEAPPGIETDRASVETHLSSGHISSLPVPNRNFTNLALLAPGAV